MHISSSLVLVSLTTLVMQLKSHPANYCLEIVYWLNFPPTYSFENFWLLWLIIILGASLLSNMFRMGAFILLKPDRPISINHGCHVLTWATWVCSLPASVGCVGRTFTWVAWVALVKIFFRWVHIVRGS